MSTYVVDFILLAILIFSIIYGWHWGTINVIAKVGAIVLAYHLARTYSTIITSFILNLFGSGSNEAAEGSQDVWAILSIFFDTDEVKNGIIGVIVFIVIFILVNWVVKKIAYALTSIFGKGILSTINRAIGAFLALVLMMGILLIIESILVPSFIEMGFGSRVEEFFLKSQLIMPFLREVTLLFN